MISFDEDTGLLTVDRDGRRQTYRLDEREAFEAVADLWLRASWSAKHAYTFTWMGRPVIQLPEDLLRLQELVHLVQPDVTIETGIAHGGLLVFHAGLCKQMGHGRVIGVDIDIRSHNRAAIEAHPLAPLIELVEGDSIAPEVVRLVADQIQPGETVLVILDSNHTKEHVLAELEAYAPLVTPGSYIVAMDGDVMEHAVGLARSAPDWATNNPNAAAAEFVASHPGFELSEPPFLFNESNIERAVTGWRGGAVRRVT